MSKNGSVTATTHRQVKREIASLRAELVYRAQRIVELHQQLAKAQEALQDIINYGEVGSFEIAKQALENSKEKEI